MICFKFEHDWNDLICRETKVSGKYTFVRFLHWLAKYPFSDVNLVCDTSRYSRSVISSKEPNDIVKIEEGRIRIETLTLKNE